MADNRQQALANIVSDLRKLPKEWKSWAPEEFDRLPSDDRAETLKRRVDLLSTVGRFLIKAVLDHGWRPSDRSPEIEDRAHWARELERTKMYERGAIKFLGMFVDWYRDHPELLPAGAPALNPLKVHLSNYRPEAVPREDFARTCDAIAWLVSATQAPDREVTSLGPGGDEVTTQVSPATLAMAILFENPDISPTDLAKQIGVSRSTLYSRSKKWIGVRRTLTARDQAQGVKGTKSADGELDAEAEGREFHPTRDE